MGMTASQEPTDETPLSPAQAHAAAEYNAPTEAVPREMMWNAIQLRRANVERALTAGDGTSVPPVTVTHTTRGALSRMPRVIAATAVAAAIVLAVVITRRAPEQPVSVATLVDTAATTVVWQTAGNEHFGLAESMLTTLGYATESQGNAQLSAWSRDLLESTRLLMDSPAGRDPRRRVLLQDLELVLVQLVESGPAMEHDDRTGMDDLLSRSALLLTRIRTIVPAGTSAPRN
jgi:hypothetical protein